MALWVVRFINSDDFVSHAIDWVTNSLFDHVEMGTPEGTWIGAHAGSGIQERVANYCVPTRERRYALPCSDYQLATILASARRDIGIPYNYEGIIGLLLHSRNFTDEHRDFCSQWMMKKSELFEDLALLNVAAGWEYLVTPETLHLSPKFRGHLVFSKG